MQKLKIPTKIPTILNLSHIGRVLRFCLLVASPPLKAFPPLAMGSPCKKCFRLSCALLCARNLPPCCNPSFFCSRTLRPRQEARQYPCMEHGRASPFPFVFLKVFSVLCFLCVLRVLVSFMLYFKVIDIKNSWTRQKGRVSSCPERSGEAGK